MTLIINIIVTVSFVLLGLYFSTGKGGFLIAGYNTSSKEAKAKINESKLCKFMSKFMFILAACWLLITLGQIVKILLKLGIVLFIAATIFSLIYMNTGDRFKK